MQLPEAVRLLLESGASMTRPSRQQRRTPLELAFKERPTMVPILLEHLQVLEKFRLSKRQLSAADLDDEPPKKIRSLESR